MAEQRRWKERDRIHLASDPKWVGSITYATGPEISGDIVRYSVKWDKISSEHIYYGDMLISKEEGEKILADLAKTSSIDTVKSKAKSVIKSVTDAIVGKEKSE